MKDLYIARPMKLGMRFDEPVARLPLTLCPMRITLKDPEPLLEYLTSLYETLIESDIRLDGVLFGVSDYFTLRDLANTRSGWYCEMGEDGLTINGVRICLDPMRDDGPPVAMFEESEAIKVMSMRRKT